MNPRNDYGILLYELRAQGRSDSWNKECREVHWARQQDWLHVSDDCDGRVDIQVCLGGDVVLALLLSPDE